MLMYSALTNTCLKQILSQAQDCIGGTESLIMLLCSAIGAGRWCGVCQGNDVS